MRIGKVFEDGRLLCTSLMLGLAMPVVGSTATGGNLAVKSVVQDFGELGLLAGTIGCLTLTVVKGAEVVKSNGQQGIPGLILGAVVSTIAVSSSFSGGIGALGIGGAMVI